MKIRPTPLTPNQSNEKTSLRSAYSQSNPQQSSLIGSEASGSVQLSAAARALQELQNDSNDIHVERVQAIKQALESGQLQINPTAIADGLLESAKELLK